MHSLSYLPSFNRFADSKGVIVHDLYQIFDTWQLSEWKRKGRTSVVKDKDGNGWKLIYLNEYEEEDILDLLSLKDSFGLKTNRQYYY